MVSQRRKARVRELAKEIDRLEADLAARHRELDRLLGEQHLGDPDDDAEGADAEISGAERATYVRRIESALARAGSAAQTAQAVTTAIGEPQSLETVRAILSKLFKAGVVERPSPNQYRLRIGGHARLATEDD